MCRKTHCVDAGIHRGGPHAVPVLPAADALLGSDLHFENVFMVRSAYAPAAWLPHQVLQRQMLCCRFRSRRQAAVMVEELLQRIDARVRLMLERVERDQTKISGDLRVSEASANQLLGFDGEDTLRKLREYGRGPVFHRLSVNGSRYSYALIDLATWIESKRGCDDEPA